MTDIHKLRIVGPDAIEHTNTVWGDLSFAFNTLTKGGVKAPDLVKLIDDGSGSEGAYLYGFDATAEEELFFGVQLLPDYKLGTNLHPHIHWAPTTTNTGTVIWGLEYSISKVGSVFGNTTLLEASDICDGTQHKHTLTSLGEIDCSSINIMSAVLLCRLYRKSGSDTYADDAALLEIDFNYEIDTIGGSSGLYTK